MNDKERSYNGLIVIRPYGEYDDALFLVDSKNSDIDEPLVEILETDKGEMTNLTVRYWISDIHLTRDQLLENTVMQAMGIGDIEFTSHYSEVTGYLWTDENFNVGGHNLEAEIRSSVGKWLYMEIVYAL